LKIAAGYAGHTQVLGLFDRSVSVDQERTTVDHIAFTIGLPDYDSERQRLEKLGLNVEAKDHEWVNWRSLYFQDPEGNRIELVCYDESLSASAKKA
jgi:catechol-2,3-dioxygenase